MFDFGDNPIKIIRTALFGLVTAGIVALIYIIADRLDPGALPYAFTVIVACIAVIVLVAGWLCWIGWTRFRAKRAKQNIPKAKGDRLSIVIATLKNDDGATIAERVLLALRDEFGDRVEVLRVSELIASGSDGSEDIRQLAARRAGQDLLSRTRADVLIWGAALRAEKVVDLNFLAREADSGPGGTRSYGLSQTMRLPAEFGTDLSAALAAVAASAASLAIDNAGHYLVEVLRPVVQRLQHIVESPPASLQGNSRAEVFHAFALASRNIGDQSGDNASLERATRYYREVLKVWTRETSPSDWAMTQNNLGIALRNLGERESGTARLEEAVAAYREALKEYTRERVPLDWAMTQNNLGTALRILGERESGTARLEEAVAAYREALKEYARERVPLDWAMTQNNLGNALGNLGERESGTARLEEAVAAYREALKERSRDRVPLKWAMTQNNLGNALGDLGERESGTARLEEAVVAYREALKECTRERVPLDWATTQNNLGTALGTLGARESGTARLEEAVAAYREALKERTRDRVPLDWAMTQNNLGNTLRNLGERESGTARLEEAVAAYREALTEFESAGTSFYIEVARRNIKFAEAILNKRRGS